MNWDQKAEGTVVYVVSSPCYFPHFLELLPGSYPWLSEQPGATLLVVLHDSFVQWRVSEFWSYWTVSPFYGLIPFFFQIGC